MNRRKQKTLTKFPEVSAKKRNDDGTLEEKIWLMTLYSKGNIRETWNVMVLSLITGTATARTIHVMAILTVSFRHPNPSVTIATYHLTSLMLCVC